MREYTILALVGVAAVVVFELAWARTGLFARRAYWVTMAIVFGFQSLVDGWLTKLGRGHTIVIYEPPPVQWLAVPLGHPAGGLPLCVRPGHDGDPAVGTFGRRSRAATATFRHVGTRARRLKTSPPAASISPRIPE